MSQRPESHAVPRLQIESNTSPKPVVAYPRHPVNQATSDIFKHQCIFYIKKHDRQNKSDQQLTTEEVFLEAA